MNREIFLKQVDEIIELIQNAGGTIRAEEISDPVAKRDVEELEKAYHTSFSHDFVHYLTDVAAEVNVQWSFNRELKLSVIKSLPTFLTRYNAIYSGSLIWSFKKLTSNVEYFKKFNPDGVFVRESGAVTSDNALKGTLAICEVPCGDEIRINLAAPTEDKPVFYLSHSDPDNSYVQLAPNFETYVSNLLGIALVGSEIEQQLSFISAERKGLDCKSKNSLLWIDYLKKFNNV